MGKLMKSKLLTQIFAVAICFVLIATSVSVSAYAENEGAVNRGITIEMTTVDESGNEKETVFRPMGESGTFRLKAENTSVEQQTVWVKIKLPGNLFETDADGNTTHCYIKDFENAKFNNEDKVSISEKTDILLTKENGEYYLKFSFSEGTTFQHDFLVAFANGITQPKTVQISENDITVEQEKNTKVTKSGGAIIFQADFAWEDVRISSNPTEVQVGNGKTKTSIQYTIQNTSLNQTQSREIFTKEYEILETITLPDYISFPTTGEVTVEAADSGSKIKIGNTVIATVDGKVKEASIKEKTLTFKIYYENNQMPPAEVSNPEYKVTLENLNADVQNIKDFYESAGNDGKRLEIINKTQFKATSVFDDVKDSTAEISTPIGNPAEAWSVKKESDHPYIAPGEKIRYTITITNESEFALKKKTYEIADSLSEFLDFVPGSAVLKGYDASGAQFEETLSDSVLTGSSIACSKEMLIPKNGEVKLSFEAKVKEKASSREPLTDGSEIKNSAVIKAGNVSKTTNETTDSYIAGDPERKIKKTAQMMNGKAVIDGSTVLYTITLENSSGLKLPFDVVDELPSYVNPETVKDVQVTYTKGGKTGKAQSLGYNREGRTIRFNKIWLSRTADSNGHRADITFKVNLAGLSGAAKGTAIINKASVKQVDSPGRNLPEISDVAILNSDENKIRISVQKSAQGSPKRDTENEDLYSIDYSISLTNMGKTFTQGDTKNITDIMQGGLMPAKVPTEKGEIKGQYVTGTTTQEITGAYVTNYDQDGKVLSYTITWPINKMEYPKAGAACQEGRIAYTGYAKWENITNIKNSAAIDGSYSDVTVPVTVKPSITKKIYSINGAKTSGGLETKCDIKSGDKIVYEIKVKNTGDFTAKNCTIRDLLPAAAQIDGKSYYSSENVTVTASWNTKGLEFKGTAAHDYSKNELKWTKVDLYPKSELTLMITVQYPKGTSFAEFFLKDDLDESETTNDAILIYKEKTFESKVTHSMKRTKLKIEKSIDTKKVLQTGEDATFTISGFETQAGVYNYKVVDQLDDIYRLVTLDTLNTGAFEGISKYTLTLTYDKKENGENIQKTIIYAEDDCKINHELTADSLKHDTDSSAKVVSAEWSFNDGDYVPYLEIKQNPTLKVVVPVGNQPGKGENKAAVYYDGQKKEATAPLAAVNGIALKKSAYVNGKVVQNDTNPIKTGDQVTFRIEYKNIGKEPFALNNSNAITDYLSSKGLKASTGYPISAVLFDENGFKASQQGILKANGKTSLEISKADISAATAKKILFTYENENGSDFMIPSGHVLKISYTVTASDEFENSHWDKKNGKITENWEAKNYENSRIIHNEAKVQSAGQTVKADTGWYYQKGKNKLRVQKDVFGVGYLVMGITQYVADVYLSSISDLNFWSVKSQLRAPNNADWDNNRYNNTENYTWDLVAYNITIENDSGSEEALTVSKIIENLPGNAYGGCISNRSYLHHKLGTSIILDDRKTSSIKINWPTNNTSNSTPINIGKTFDYVYNNDSISRRANIEWDANNGQFTMKDSTTNKKLELKPGERVGFTYYVVVDRRNTDPLKWRNTTTLHIEGSEAEFQINDKLSKKSLIKDSSAKRNDGDCKKVGETQFSSTVDIYSLGNRTGIKKTSSGLYAAAKDENLGASTTLTDINNIDTADKTVVAADRVYTKIANNKKVTFNDIVEWKLEVKNQGAKQTVRITDELPYPYEAITEDNAVMQRYDTSSGTWINVEGTITTKTGGTFGTASQEIKAEIEVSAASTTTLRVLARYAGEKSKQYFSRNYRNNVKLEALNSAGNVTTISGVVEGTAQYNQNKQITAITAQDYVYPTIGAETTSVKSITNSNGKTARGDIKELNYVTTPSAGDRVRYTLEVTNNSTGNLKNFVLIDKLSQIGDTGNLDTTTGRGTEFQMKLPTNPNITVKVGNNDVTNQVSVTYKNVEPNAAFSVDDWNGHGSNWEDAATAPDRGNTTAIRINMDGIEVSNKEKITVSFDAIVGDNAVAGQIAWNTFGYAYTSALKEDMRLYAEPAKVGVKVSGKEIAVKKIWKGSTLSSRPSLTEGLTITVIGKTASGEKKVEKTYTGQAISWKEDASGKVWNAVISGLPIQVDGQELTYSITETSPTGYRQQGEIVKSEDSDNGLTQFTITNTQTKQISGLKVWNDGKETHDNPKLILQKLINGKWADVNLQEEGITLKWEEATLGDVGLTTGNDGIKHVQKYTFENLAADYIYKVDEATLNGYKSEEDGSKFTNTLLTNISVSKVWKDQDRTERPAVNVNLLSNGFVTAEKELSIANGWKAEFKELPVYDENGTKIVYTVEETKIDGYRAVIKTTLNENGTEFEITNILAADVNISGQKYWYDSNNQYESRPDSVTLKILQNDEEFKTIQVYASDSWRFEVKGLPRYDENGKDYNYSITEDRVNQYTNGVIEKTFETEDANGNKILKFEISNTYQEPNAIDIPLKFWKKLTDRDTKTAQPIGAGKFNFKVTYKNDEGVEIRKNVSNTASTGEDNLANVSFVWEGISEPGEYVFTITEEDVDSAYINIDTDPITATVTVTRPKEGDNLKIDSITYSKQGKTLAADEKPLFENELIAPQPVTVQPVLKKILLRGAIADKQFSFKLENRQGTPEYSKIVQADSDGKIAFGEIKYTEAGDYEYTISEIPGNDANIKYDSREIRMLVRVTAESTGEGDNKEVTLNAKTYYIRDGEVLTEEQPAFTNIQYAEVSTDLSIYKTIKDNAKELKENQFEFALYDETGKELDKAKNDASGKVVFTNIDGMKYSYADVDKTFIYTIKEVEGNLAGYQYSSEAITAKVTVRAGADNNLHTDVGYFNKNGEQLTNPSITNTYESPDSVTAELGVKKLYKDKSSGDAKAISNGQFSFVLNAIGNDTPMPTDAVDGRKTVTTGASSNGSTDVKFGKILYNKAGTYTYKIEEQKGDNSSITYDTTPITATVKVTLDEETNKYIVSVTYQKGSDEETSEIPTVTNLYEQPQGISVTPKVTKKLINTATGEPRNFGDDVFTFGLYTAKYVNGSLVKDETSVEKVSTSDGSKSEQELNFNPRSYMSDIAPGKTVEQYYVIKEIPGQNISIKYDTTEIIYKVVFKKDTTGNNLIAEETYTVNGVATNSPTFTNEYDAPTPASVILEAKKYFYDGNSNEAKVFGDDAFTFELYESNENGQNAKLIQSKTTTSRDASLETLRFNSIEYKDDVATGKTTTKYYLIKERKGSNPSIEYSTQEIWVKVEISKEVGDGIYIPGNNKLTASATYKLLNQDVTFTNDVKIISNKYNQPTATQANIAITKTLTGKALSANQFSFVLKNTSAPEGVTLAADKTVKNDADGKVDFGQIGYDKEGTYEYTITEVNDGKAGYTYSDKTVNVTVVVTKEANNKLKAAVSYKIDGAATSSPTLANTYTKPNPTTAELGVKKSYVNADGGAAMAIAEGQFSFVLTAKNNAPMPAGAANGKLTLAVPAGSGMQSVDFGSISYSEAGEYRYTITEEPVNDESVVIDRKTVNVTVTVAQNGTEMEATVSYDGEPTVPTFANLYKQPVTGTLQISKKFTGEGAPTTFLAGQYVFSISGNNWNGTANNDASGKVTFNLPEFTEARLYTYEIKEVGFREGMEDPSITVNKDAVITATVTVSESADHVLSVSSIKYELNGVETSDPAITNTYTKPSPTEVVLEAEKSLRATSGSAPTLTAGAYSFEVKDADDKVVAKAKNAADGKITFPQIAINDAGTYTYTISEVIPENKETGITYTTDTYKVTVTAARKANENTLEITSVVYEKADGTTVDKPAFVNTYTPPTGTQAEIEVSKELTGKVLTANMFSFTLTNTKVPAGETLAQPVTVKNDANGKVKFTLNYNKDVDADYEYEIREVNDDKAGYEYSDKVIKVTVHVGKNADNKLLTTVTYSMDGTETQDPIFVNTYTKPNPTTAELGVKKEYVNANGGAAMAIAEGQFSFVLTAKNNAPMPEDAVDGKKTVKTSAAAGGSTLVNFGDISYTELGTYTYTIAEEKGSNASISYDTAPITATVVIGLDETTNTYTMTITYSRGSETKDDGLLTVKNTYTLPSATSLTPEVTKKFVNADGSGKNFGNDVFTFKLYKSDADGTEGALVETKTTTDKNASTQTIRFSTLSYTKDRELTEYYLIKEEAGTNPSITYDTEGILVKVEVKKVGNTLQATVTYTKAGKTGDEAKVITNEYRLPQEVSVTPQVTKKFTDISGQDRNFGDDVFTFELYEAADENGTLAEGAKPIETITTTKADAAQELLKFKPISYTKDIEPGDKVTKYYVIKEAQGDNISINYDTTAIVYKVVFEKDAKDNKLKATEAYTIGGNPTNNPTITNTYKTPTPAETALTVEKYFYDKTAQADKKFGSEVFTFELFKAEDGNGTLAEGATAIDTKQASGADISRQTLTFLTLRHEQDMKPGDSVTEYYLIREKAPTNPSIKCENPEVIAKVVYSKAKAAGAYSDAANKIDVSVSYKMKGETSFAEGRKTVKNLYTEPEAVVPQAPIQVKKAFFDITGGDEAKTAKAIHAGEFSFTITAVDEAPMTGITQTVSTKDAASGTDTISFGNTTYMKEGIYRYLITENAGTNPSVAYDKHVIEVVVKVTKNSENKLVAATEYFVKENAEDAGTKEENPTFENLYTEPTATNFTPEVSKHLVDVTDGTEADRAFGNDTFTFNLYEADAAGTIKREIDTVSTSAEDEALAVKKLTFQAIELADDLAYGTDKTDFYYVIKEVKGDNPSITYDEMAILVHAEVTKNADNKLEVKVTYSRGEESSGDGLEVKNIYTKPQPAKYVIEFTKKYFDITSGTETAKNFGSEIFNFSLYESNENGEQIGEPIEEISTNGSTIFSQDLAFTERVYDQDIEPGQTVTQYYLIKEKKGANYSIGYDTKGILVKVTLTKDKQDADHPNAKNEVIASVEYLKQTNDGFTGTWSGDKQVVRNTYTTPTPVVPESPIQVKKAFFDITGGDEAKTAKAIHAGEFSFTIMPVDDAPTTGIIPTVNTKDAASGMDTISFGSTTYTKEGEYHYLITETSGKNPSVTYDKRVIEVVVTVTKTSANKLAAKTEYFVKENAEAAGTLTTNPTFENLYKAPTATNFVPEVIKHLVDVTSGAEIDRVFGKDSFTFKLYEADAAGTIKGGAIDTVSTGEEDKELALKKLAFKQIDISNDLEYGTDKTEYFYIIREEAEANPSIQDDVREILVKVTVTKTTDNKLAAKVAYIRGEEQKDTALTVTNRYTEPEPTSFTPEATKKLTGRDLKDGEFIFELLDAEGNVIDTAANAADGKIRFKTLTFKEDADAKDYVYSIREVKGNLSAVIYDKSVYTIKIHVIKNAQNKLEITDVKYVKDEKDVENITFSNTYSPYVPSVVVDITASKQFEGGILNGKDFTFKLEPVNKTEGYVRTAYNEKDGSINFGKFIYFREGVYEYILSEIVGSDRNIGYDKAQIKVTVTVRQDKYKLVADVKYDKNGQETNIFVNKNGIDPDKTSVSLYAQKILQGGELEANDFTFRLTPLNGAPGKSQQVKNTAVGDVVFDNITFTEVGTYRYEIRELQMSSKKNISYDKQKVYAAVRVYRDEYGQLLAEVSYTKNGADTNTFINKSRDDDGKPPVKPDRDSDGKFPQRPDDGTPKTGDEMMFTLWILVCLGAGAGLFAASRKNHKE